MAIHLLCAKMTAAQQGGHYRLQGSDEPLDEKMNLGRKRGRTVLLVGVLALLAVLCLALLTSAQASPVTIATAASPDTILSGSTVQFTTTFTNGAETDLEILAVTHTLATQFEFVSMAENSVVLQEPALLAGTLAWKDQAFTLPVNQASVLAYTIRVDGTADPEPYQNLVEARLSTGEVLFSTVSVQVVEQEQSPDPEPIAVTPTLTETEPVTVLCKAKAQ